VQQLCVAKYTNPTDWWSFVQCQNFQGRDRIGTPDVALNCAKTSGIDWVNGGAGECAGVDGSGRGAEGVRLLQESVMATKALGIQCVSQYVDTLQLIDVSATASTSCTILINGRQVCIHDRVWKECQVFQRCPPLKPAVDFPSRPAIPLVILSDKLTTNTNDLTATTMTMSEDIQQDSRRKIPLTQEV
jgi:hypothetical protein